MAGKAGIVLAHGLWADGSCFAKLIPALQAEGREVFASQHGLDSLAGDVDCVTRAINHVPGPVVLVGHSYGGTLITKAGVHDQVGALVYICALAPDDDETSQQHLAAFPSTPVFEHLEVADNRIYLTESGIGDFCGDLSPEDQKLVLATASAPVADLFDQQVPGNAWRAKPSWFIVGNQDRTVNPDRERASAERMKATTVSLDSSHVPMLSQPDAVLEVIRNAAATLE
ncbi:alpha/beta hydrolase [Streptomyces sp. NPDC051920]|uniref:alpha/beta fold hydrolase n=1 Tax=Streptomyces sp. NPDC051920 TaxID=3155523 RepID=UPI003436A9AE